MTPETLLRCLQAAGAAVEDEPAAVRGPEITHSDLYELGLSGRSDSKARRLALQKRLGLPALMSTNALLTALNAIYTRDEFLEKAKP